MSRLYHSSRADEWNAPRPFRDASSRYHKHGPVRPMEDEPRCGLRCMALWLAGLLAAAAVLAFFTLA